MPHSEAQAWWADVQHVRESIERRRAGLADSSAPLGAHEERRFTRAAAESLPVMDDLDWSSTLPDRPRGRFDHTRSTDRDSRPRHPAGDVGWEDYDGTWVDARDRDHAPGHGDDDERFDFDAERAALDRGRDDRDVTAERRVSHADRAGTPSNPSTTTAPATTAIAPPPSRRTVQITGRTVAAPALPRLVEVERRRPARRPTERVGPRPDRIALWAVLLGFFLILVAATSSNAETQPAGADQGAPVALHASAR